LVKNWLFGLKTNFFAKQRLSFAQNMYTSTKNVCFYTNVGLNWSNLVEFEPIWGQIWSNLVKEVKFDQIWHSNLSYESRKFEWIRPNLEITIRGRFHQRFSRAFFVRLIQNVTRKKDVCTKNACEKRWWNRPQEFLHLFA